MDESNLKSAVSIALERNKLLRGPDVGTLTQIGRTKRSELIKAGLFPKPIKHLGENALPGRTNYWTQGDILDYLQARVAERNKQLAEVANQGLNGWLNRAIEVSEDNAMRTSLKCSIGNASMAAAYSSLTDETSVSEVRMKGGN